MIERYIQDDDMFQPRELQALQICFDQLTTRLAVTGDDNEKAVLAILLLAAFRGTRDAEKAGELAGLYYNISGSSEVRANPSAGRATASRVA